MRETIGLRSNATLINPSWIKRDALMFRKIGVISLDNMIRNGDGPFVENAAELRWLFEQGIVFDPQLKLLHEARSLDNETKKILDEARNLMTRHREGIEQSDIAEELRPHMEKEGMLQGTGLELFESIRKTPEGLKRMVSTLMSGELLLRPLTAYYRNSKKVDAYPLFNITFPEVDQRSASMGDVIDITQSITGAG